MHSHYVVLIRSSAVLRVIHIMNVSIVLIVGNMSAVPRDARSRKSAVPRVDLSLYIGML